MIADPFRFNLGSNRREDRRYKHLTCYLYLVILLFVMFHEGFMYES